jgi:cysteine desulfuration protein SufE
VPAPSDNERRLNEDFLPLTDPQERLALIVEACAGGGIPAPGRRDADLVPGCVSRVWLRGSALPNAADEGRAGEIVSGQQETRLRLVWDAESPLVRGLAGLICQIYDGAPLAEIPPHKSALLSTLGLARQLSPTRLRGLGAVEARIHQLAAELMAAGESAKPAAGGPDALVPAAVEALE